MAKDYSTAKEEEQMQNGELTPDQILTALGLDKKVYMVKKSFSGDAVNAAKKKVKNVQIFQYDLYKKENGKWVKKSWSKSWFESGGLNNYAIYGSNGIVIVKPFSLAKAKGIKNVSAPTAALTDNSSLSVSETPMESTAFSQAPSWMEPIGIKGEDEQIIRKLSFAKLCLLKECYESLGVLL